MTVQGVNGRSASTRSGDCYGLVLVIKESVTSDGRSLIVSAHGSLPMACHGSCEQSRQPPRHAPGHRHERRLRKTRHGGLALNETGLVREHAIMATTPDNNEMQQTRSALARSRGPRS